MATDSRSGGWKRIGSGHLSALMLAAINHHLEIVRLLADAGAEREIRGTGAPGFAGLTALGLAERAGYQEVATLLRRAAE